MPQEDLTDEQMEEMLAQATTRLREKEESNMFKTETPQKYTFPKMNAGELEKPYVVTKGHIAEADKARLIDQKHRQTDSLIRKVEDPVTARKLAAEVRSHYFSTPIMSMRKISQFSLEQSRGTVLVLFCQTESLFIHSYSETLPPHCLAQSTISIGASADIVTSKRKQLLAHSGTTCRARILHPSSRETCSC